MKTCAIGALMLAAASVTHAASSDLCGTEEKAYATSVNLGARSFHPHSSVNYYDFNKLVGVRKYFGCVPHMSTARIFGEGNLVVPNSLGGVTTDVVLGAQWGPRLLSHKGFQGGVEVMAGYMWYHVPADNPRQRIPHGITFESPVLMGGPFLQYGPHSVHATVLQKPKDFIRLKWERATAIIVTYNYEFR